MKLFVVNKNYINPEAHGMVVKPLETGRYEYVTGPDVYPYARHTLVFNNKELDEIPEELQKESLETIKFYYAL